MAFLVIIGFFYLLYANSSAAVLSEYTDTKGILPVSSLESFISQLPNANIGHQSGRNPITVNHDDLVSSLGAYKTSTSKARKGVLEDTHKETSSKARKGVLDRPITPIDNSSEDLILTFDSKTKNNESKDVVGNFLTATAVKSPLNIIPISIKSPFATAKVSLLGNEKSHNEIDLHDNKTQNIVKTIQENITFDNRHEEADEVQEDDSKEENNTFDNHHEDDGDDSKEQHDSKEEDNDDEQFPSQINDNMEIKSTTSPVSAFTSPTAILRTSTATGELRIGSEDVTPQSSVVKSNSSSSQMKAEITMPKPSFASMEDDSTKSSSNRTILIAIISSSIGVCAIVGFITYKRLYAYWHRRHYARVDFLIDGLYEM